MPLTTLPSLVFMYALQLNFYCISIGGLTSHIMTKIALAPVALNFNDFQRVSTDKKPGIIAAISAAAKAKMPLNMKV